MIDEINEIEGRGFCFKSLLTGKQVCRGSREAAEKVRQSHRDQVEAAASYEEDESGNPLPRG